MTRYASLVVKLLRGTSNLLIVLTDRWLKSAFDGSTSRMFSLYVHLLESIADQLLSVKAGGESKDS